MFREICCFQVLRTAFLSFRLYCLFIGPLLVLFHHMGKYPSIQAQSCPSDEVNAGSLASCLGAGSFLSGTEACLAQTLMLVGIVWGVSEPAWGCPAQLLGSLIRLENHM